MERLTFEGNFCDIAQCENTPGGSYCESGSCSQRETWEKLKQYEGTGFDPEFCETAAKAWAALSSIGWTVERAAELLRADKEGHAVVLPCKVGDTVWAILDRKKHSRECKVDFVNIGKCGVTVVLREADGLKEQLGVTFAAFGKTVFLTREEAEEALRRDEDG